MFTAPKMAFPCGGRSDFPARHLCSAGIPPGNDNERRPPTRRVSIYFLR